MKFFILFSILIISLEAINAQTIVWTFTGQDKQGNSILIDSVHIVNQSNGEELKINGNIFNSSDESTFVQGIDNQKINIKGYPNPFRRETNLSISSSTVEEATIRIFDTRGRELIKLNDVLSTGDNNYSFGIQSKGLILVSVNSKSIQKTIKFICIEENTKTFLTKQGISEKSAIIKSTTVSQTDFSYESGQYLKIIGYSNNRVSLSNYISPELNSTIQLSFSNNYYKIVKNQIFTRYPSFVNILFSVQNQDNKGIEYLTTSDFEVREDDQTVSASESFMYITKLNTVPYTLKTVLLLDNSASVRDNLTTIKQAAINLIDRILPNQEMAIMSFSSSSNLIQNFTNDKELLKKALNSIELGYPSTDLYGSVIKATNLWSDNYNYDIIEQGQLLIFTDGDDTQGSYSLTDAITSIGNKRTYVVGLGSDINPENLNKLANPGPIFQLDEINNLNATFQEIQNDIISQTNSFYWMTYMTPKRTGSHNLELHINDNTNANIDGYIEDNFNANEFIDVTSGVYANVEPGIPYGIKQFKLDDWNSQIQLTADTYWAFNKPKYVWTDTGKNVVEIKSLDSNGKNVIIKGTSISDTTSTKLILKDISNNYSDTISVDLELLLAVVKVDSIYSIDTLKGTARFDFTIQHNGNSKIFDKGIIWNWWGNPQFPGNFAGKESLGSGYGSYTAVVDNLLGFGIYSFTPYVSNRAGISYGREYKIGPFFEYGELIDSRDGNTYQTAQIGSAIWMAENLAYQTDSNSWLYNDKLYNEPKYGRLYTWEMAQKACPSGWHLPTDDEWQELERVIGIDNALLNEFNYRGTEEANRLKLAPHWKSDIYNIPTMESGFNAKPGGIFYIQSGEFNFLGEGGFWWTSTIYTNGDPIYRELRYDQGGVKRDIRNKKHYGLSVRCVKD